MREMDKSLSELLSMLGFVEHDIKKTTSCFWLVSKHTKLRVRLRLMPSLNSNLNSAILKHVGGVENVRLFTSFVASLAIERDIVRPF